MSTPRVLIVEDEFLIRMTLSEVLTEEGFEVVEAADSAEALAALEREAHLDAMLTDIQLPGGLDGHHLAARARQTRPDMPVVFMSGRPEPGPLGPRDLQISKPYSPMAVAATLRRLIDDTATP
ncbi:response regulator [Rhizosaccharibacter radicis]|uniref:Response regulator n=1 Tax=Rhizosaccharibacter radicis TaxID=2782605 RepID=A0ABT1VUD7_9PROT|nr:response regulator [Acetobacteraceae bacterium KSS12]